METEKTRRVFSQEEVELIMGEVLNLGMTARQQQLQGYQPRSGKEIMAEWWEEYLELPTTFLLLRSAKKRKRSQKMNCLKSSSYSKKAVVSKRLKGMRS